MRALRIGLVLLILGVLCWIARTPYGGHGHSWSPGATAPTSIALTAGKTYHLSTVHGAEGGQLASCQLSRASQPGSASSALPLLPISGDRVIHEVNAFISPATGRARITCVGAGGGAVPVFVDDADGVGHDRGSVLLVAAIALGSIGLIFCTARVSTKGRPGPGGNPPAGRQSGDETHLSRL
jgi:hypothetical protein